MPWLQSLKERLLPHAVPLVLLSIMTLAVYLPSLNHEFLTNWDDPVYVTNNEAVRGITPSHVVAAFSSFYSGNFAPLQILSYMMDFDIWGMKAMGFILTNILLHLANGALFYRLLLLVAFSRFAAFLATFIFLLHPIQVESVVWISQRKNLLAMFFFLTAFICYIRHMHPKRYKSGASGIYVCSLGAFSCALLAKAVAVVLPVALLLYDYCYTPTNSLKSRIGDKIPFVLLGILIAVITVIAQKYNINEGGGMTAYHGGGPYQTFLTMLPVMVLYLKLLFYPVDLSAVYDPEIKYGIDPAVLGSSAVVIALIAIGVWLFRHTRDMAFWYALFFLCLVPVSQIFPLVTLINDRYLYFPMIGAAALAGHTIARLCTSQTIRNAYGATTVGPMLASVIILLPLMVLPYLSWKRAAVWQNSVTLWTDTVKKTLNNYTLFSLGDAYNERNDIGAAKKLFRLVIDKDPLHYKALNNLACIYIQQHDYPSARPLLLTLTKAYPDYAQGFANLGGYYYMNGDIPMAEKNFQKALSIKPDLPQTLLALGNINMARRDLKVANAYLLQALPLMPRNPELYYSLACLKSLEGITPEALNYLGSALNLGYRNRKNIFEGEELASIRKLPEFRSIVSRYFQ